MPGGIFRGRPGTKVAPDPLPGWWRYHQLFADLLRVRLQQEPERGAGIAQGAACWSQAHGLAGQAVRHALAAGDGARAARLVERHAHELLLAQARPALLSVARRESLSCFTPPDARWQTPRTGPDEPLRAFGRPVRQPAR
jgi:hypothetical protein